MEIKRLPVLSDTHGDILTLEAVLQWTNRMYNGAIVEAVFLGDGIRDLSRAVSGFSPEWKLVRGNNDDSRFAPEAAVFDFCGHRFLLCHGHRHSLYGSLHSLVAAARNTEAQAVLFGHTHVPYCGYVEGVRLINPGSIGRPRGNTGATFAVIECTPELPFEVRFYGINPDGGIRELSFA